MSNYLDVTLPAKGVEGGHGVTHLGAGCGLKTGAVTGEIDDGRGGDTAIHGGGHAGGGAGNGIQVGNHSA